MATNPRFSPSAAWDEASRLLRSETRLIVAIAGVFFLLPAVLVDAYGPNFDAATTFEQMMRALEPYLPYFLLISLIQYVGQLAIFTLFLTDRPTVGQAIAKGFQLLPFYFLLTICTNIMIGLGLLLLIVPGIYLICRLAASGPALVAEDLRWPFPAIQRSFALTKGNALPIFALLLIVAIVFIMVLVVTTLIVGAVVGLSGLDVTQGAPGGILLSIASGVVGAAGTTIFTLLAIAIYRQLAGDRRAERVFR